MLTNVSLNSCSTSWHSFLCLQTKNKQGEAAAASARKPAAARATGGAARRRPPRRPRRGAADGHRRPAGPHPPIRSREQVRWLSPRQRPPSHPTQDDDDALVQARLRRCSPQWRRRRSQGAGDRCRGAGQRGAGAACAGPVEPRRAFETVVFGAFGVAIVRLR